MKRPRTRTRLVPVSVRLPAHLVALIDRVPGATRADKLRLLLESRDAAEAIGRAAGEIIAEEIAAMRADIAQLADRHNKEAL